MHSTICGFEHKIEGKREDETIHIHIESACEKIQKMSGMEIPMMEIFDIKENYVMNKAQELKCSSNCLVPCGILHVCRIEAGLLLESLCRNSGGVSITFDED